MEPSANSLNLMIFIVLAEDYPTLGFRVYAFVQIKGLFVLVTDTVELTFIPASLSEDANDVQTREFEACPMLKLLTLSVIAEDYPTLRTPVYAFAQNKCHF